MSEPEPGAELLLGSGVVASAGVGQPAAQVSSAGSRPTHATACGSTHASCAACAAAQQEQPPELVEPEGEPEEGEPPPPIRIAIIGPGAGVQNPKTAGVFTRLAGTDEDAELFLESAAAKSGGEMSAVIVSPPREEGEDRQLCLFTGGTGVSDGGHEQLYAFGQSLREDIVRYAPTLLYCGSRGGLVLSGLLATWKPNCPLLVVNAFGRERALLYREGVDSESLATYADAEQNPGAERVPPSHAIENAGLCLILVQSGDSDYMSRGRDLRQEFASFAGAVLTYRNLDDDHNPASLQRVVVDLARVAHQLHHIDSSSSSSPSSSSSAAQLLEVFRRHVRGSPFAPPPPCEFSIKLAGPQAAWAVLPSSTFATHSAAAGGAGAPPPRGGLMAAIQARSK
jgi:hypothetical protein